MSGEAVIGWVPEVDARIWQAFVAGAFVAMGWLVNGWQNRRAARALRAERLRDVHRALFAEIGAHLATLGTEADLDGYGAAIVARMEEDPGFAPFVPHERNDQVFQAVVGDIHVLPRTSIDPVVAYYNQLGSIAAFVEDMRGGRFARLGVERKVLIYRDYIAMKKQAMAFGHHALRMIDAYARGGRDEALRVEEETRRATLRRQAELTRQATGAAGSDGPEAGGAGASGAGISSPGAGRSDRSPGSA